MFRLVFVVIAVAMMPVKGYASDVMLFMSVNSPVSGLDTVRASHDVNILFIDSYLAVIDPINRAGRTVGGSEAQQQTFIQQHIETIDKAALSKAVGDSLKVNALANKLGIHTFPAVVVRVPEGLKIVRFKGRVDVAVRRALQ